MVSKIRILSSSRFGTAGALSVTDVIGFYPLPGDRSWGSPLVALRYLKVVDPLSTTRRTAEFHAAQGPVSGNRKPFSHQHTNSRARS
ncbi:hypothetical protein HYPGJ_20105 [Hyphomicrobium sp. GJ21]|nr:hypothetical protein HYPGJ_20105 [Hyphomicrobium sp. GJ21]